MNVRESVRLSWRSIRDHTLRSVLTTLGIVIGIGAVITFVTLGTSLQAAVVGDVAGDTSPEMTVSAAVPQQSGPGNGPDSGPTGGGGSPAVFTERDVDRLSELPDVESVTPEGRVSTAALGRDDETLAWESVTATTPEAFDNRTFEDGGAFTTGEDEVVLTQSATTLFEPNMTVGDRLTVQFDGGRSRTLTVVGVLDASNQQGGFDREQPRIYVPVDPVYERTVESPTTGSRQLAYSQVTVRASSYEAVPDVEADVERYLQERSDARELKPGSYELAVETNEQLVEQVRSMLQTFTGFTTGIAVISLLVGSIGIANIMLVSVTERTREIGIMKAVGAQRRDVLQLFLVEAVILGVIGSVVGVAVGVGGGYVATDLMGYSVVFAPRWFGVAVLVGVGVGIVSGLYPAWNAARIDPIDALRHE